jgi:HK97 family phage major capsid protein
MENEFKELLEKSTEDLLAKVDEKFKTIEEKTGKIDKFLSVKSSEEEEKLEKTGGFSNFGEFVKSVHGAKNIKTDAKMKKWLDVATKTFNESVDSDGGLLVPPEISKELWSRAIEDSKFFDKCFKIPTSSNEYHLPALVDESHASNLYGGVQMYYRREEEQYTASSAKIREIEWRLNKLTGLAYVSDELLEDSSYNANQIISQLFSNAIRWRIDKDILTGSGVAQPLGIYGSPCVVSVAEEDGQSADTIVFKNIVNMYARQWGKGSAFWVVNDTALPQLMSLYLGDMPLWIPGNDLSKAPNGTLLGRPVITSEHCSAVGDLGDIAFVDFSQYGVAYKNNGGVTTETSMHLRFDYDQMAFKIKFRWDGQPMWNSAFTPENGDTLSPFVLLEERA